ncbi:unnamed protein product [Linum trigynum]|uniref:S-protein homolog n=1 Tax=Linum trigynum TaxID=586398 RepID=A0AAV2EQQ1_9ROSI
MREQQHGVLVLLLLLPNIVVTIEGKHVIPKKGVVVTNEVEGERELTIHCKSRVDDLGLHELKPRQSYAWTFYPSFWTFPLYCTMDWGEGARYFDMYIYRKKGCDICRYFIRKRGPCLANKNTETCYDWIE